MNSEVQMSRTVPVMVPVMKCARKTPTAMSVTVMKAPRL